MLSSQLGWSTRTWRQTSLGERMPFFAALLLQAVVLYSPRAPGVGGGIGIDKFVHATVFAAAFGLGLRCGLPLPALFFALLSHAVISEVIQATLLPNRAGDFRDILANSLGLSAVLLWRIILGPEPKL